jgi:non-ribosomal peptide synthetase component F
VAAEEAARPFDLGAEAPLRARLLRVAPGEHVLVVVVHHIASDGWSAGVLAGDLSVAYAARCRGEAPGWAPLPVQYSDYAAWQRELLGDEDDPGSLLAVQVGYWREVLGGAPPEVVLPVDRPRPLVSSHRGHTVAVEVPAGVHGQLVGVCRGQGVTLFMAAHVALAVLLARLGAGDDIVVGSPAAGRADAALDGLVGFFVNTLVLRTSVAGDPAFTGLLAQVRAGALAAFDHADVPFERLVEVLAPQRSLGRHPLFQVMLAVQNNAAAVLGLPGVTVTVEAAGPAAAKFDLAFTLGETFRGGAPAGLTVAVTGAADLFDEATVAAVAGRFTGVLAALAADPGQRVSAITVVGAVERHQLVEEWNATGVVVAEVTLPVLVEAQAGRAADAVAVVCGGEAVSYGELNVRANRLARYLVSVGAGPECVVAVALERSVGLVTALLAVVKAGAAYLPVDLSLPAQRVAFMLADTRPAALITGGAGGGGVLGEVLAAGAGGGGAVRVVALDDPATVAVLAGLGGADLADVDRVGPLAPAHPAYVIYTSGSTGAPKGVTVTHAGVVNQLVWMQAEYRLAGGDVVLQKTPFSFDVSVWELFWPVVTGARLVMARPGGHRDPLYLADVIGAEGVSVTHFVPSMLAVFLAAHPGGAAELCPGLRLVF